MPIFFNSITPVTKVSGSQKPRSSTDGVTKTYAELREIAQREQRRLESKKVVEQAAKPPKREKKKDVVIEKPKRNNKTSAYMQDLMNK